MYVFQPACVCMLNLYILFNTIVPSNILSVLISLYDCSLTVGAIETADGKCISHIHKSHESLSPKLSKREQSPQLFSGRFHVERHGSVHAGDHAVGAHAIQWRGEGYLNCPSRLYLRTVRHSAEPLLPRGSKQRIPCGSGV